MSNLVILKETEATTKPFVAVLEHLPHVSSAMSDRGMCNKYKIVYASATKEGHIRLAMQLTTNMRLNDSRVMPLSYVKSGFTTTHVLVNLTDMAKTSTSRVDSLLDSSTVIVKTETSDGPLAIKVTAENRWCTVIDKLRGSLLHNIGICYDREELKSNNQDVRDSYIQRQCDLLTALLKLYKRTPTYTDKNLTTLERLYREYQICLSCYHIPVSMQQLEQQGLINCAGPVYIPVQTPLKAFANTLNKVKVQNVVQLNDVRRGTVPQAVLSAYGVSIDELREKVGQISQSHYAFDTTGNAVLFLGYITSKLVSKKQMLSNINKLSNITAEEV